MMHLLDLFSGIGGFSLGLERSGAFKTVAFCEIEPYCQKVLAKHWPQVPIYDDVRTITADRLASDGITVDAICGGFPCQDISILGKGAGLAGERSGLWFEVARLIRELEPRYVILENVSALLSRGIDRVLGDLASLRYDAEWHCISAYAVGASHRRDRVWIVAHTDKIGWEGLALRIEKRPKNFDTSCLEKENFFRPPNLSVSMGRLYGDPSGGIHRLDDGVPSALDRLGALGNSIVPQIPELIGRAIAAREAA